MGSTPPDELEVEAESELSNFGKNLEAAMKRQNVTRSGLASAAGVSRVQLWRMMTGRAPVPDAVAKRLAELIGIEPALLMTSGLDDRGVSEIAVRVARLMARTGRSRAEIAAALQVDVSVLNAAVHGAAGISTKELMKLRQMLVLAESELENQQWEPEVVPEPEASAQGVELEEWVQDMDRIVRTLRTAPRGPLAVPLKLAILEAAEEAAAMVGATMPKEFMEIRRKVLTGDL